MMNYRLPASADTWLFTVQNLHKLRVRANLEARRAISKLQSQSTTSSSSGNEKYGILTPSSIHPVLEVQCFVSDIGLDRSEQIINLENDFGESNKVVDVHRDTFLTAKEEDSLIKFYSSKLFSLIGPNAQIPRLRKDVKVASTAALFLRRFYLSNSVMIYDPKSMMVGAAFLASKVEDSTVDIRYLEYGTKMMHSVVSIPDIITAEMNLITGIDFQLLCYHPYNFVLATAEDLRIFLKSEQSTIQDTDIINKTIVGEDLRSIHDEARRIVDDAAVSDIPLLASPAHIGLASMMLANQNLVSAQMDNSSEHEESTNTTNVTSQKFHGYIQSRFTVDHDQEEVTRIIQIMDTLCCMLKELREGKYGCGNHRMDLERLKCIHKKLKKCRTWIRDPATKKITKRKREK